MEDSFGSTEGSTTEESGYHISGLVCIGLVLGGLVIVSALLVLLAAVCAPKDEDGPRQPRKVLVKSVSFEKEGAVYGAARSKDTLSLVLQQHFIVEGRGKWFVRFS